MLATTKRGPGRPRGNFEIEVTFEQAQELRKILADNRRTRRALGVLLMHMAGIDHIDTANFLMVAPNTVKAWCREWAERGVYGYYRRSSAPSLSDREQRLLEVMVEFEPVMFHFDLPHWTSDALQEHLSHQIGRTVSTDEIDSCLRELDMERDADGYWRLRDE